MKIYRSSWRRWGRLMVELGAVCGCLWLIWGVLLGVMLVKDDTLAPDVRDGDLVFYDKVLAPNAEDLVIWPNGEIGRWNGDGEIVGRVILLWRTRGI